MALQQVTVNVTVNTIAGSAAAAAKVIVTLAGYGSQIPELVNGAILGQVKQSFIVPVSGQLSFQVWGNDVISPGGTFYCVQLLDPKGNVIAATNYLLVGGGALNLSALLPYDPTRAQGIFYVATLNNQGPPGVAGGVAGAFSGRVVPAGLINNVNQVFTVPGNPTTLLLYKNGAKLDETSDYTYVYTSPSLTTLTLNVAPGVSGPPDNQVDNLEFYGYSSADLETTVSDLVGPSVTAAVQNAIATQVAAVVAQQVATALLTQVPAAVTTALIALGLAPQPASLAITGQDGQVYLIQSFYDQLRVVPSSQNVSGAPSSYPIQDAGLQNGTTYLITVGAGGQLNDPQPVTGVAGAPDRYNLPDPNQKTNALQVIDGQFALTPQS